MAIASVPDELLVAWMVTQITGERDAPASYLALVKMTDAQKTSSLNTFLNARVASNATEISGLSAQTQAATDALNADTTSTNAAITALNS